MYPLNKECFLFFLCGPQSDPQGYLLIPTLTYTQLASHTATNPFLTLPTHFTYGETKVSKSVQRPRFVLVAMLETKKPGPWGQEEVRTKLSDSKFWKSGSPPTPNNGTSKNQPQETLPNTLEGICCQPENQHLQTQLGGGQEQR